MSTINTDSFEDLAQQCVLSGSQNRLLYVFVRVGSVDSVTQSGLGEGEEATMVQVLFDAHQPAAHGMTFSAIREAADAHNTDWNMVVVAIAQNSDNTMPNEKQAQGFLNDMREKIMIGAVDGYALLDRDGNAVEVETEVVPMETGTAIN